MRVLFVDDEQDVLDGLENRLRHLRKQWSMRFAHGPDKALQLIDQQAFDVIVTDMRMPGMDGGELLTKVRKAHPALIRIVLSGQTEKESMLRALSVAHQVLAKPCDAAQLENAIHRAHSVNQLLNNARMRELIHGIARLPALPKLYLELTESLEQPEVSLVDLAHIIERDVGMSAHLLRVVNSGFFALSQPISATQDAIAYLGLTTVRSLVLTLELFAALDVGKTTMGFSLGALQAHSLRAAKIAATLVADEEERKVAYSAAMLHDIGALVLATSLPKLCDQAVDEAVQSQKRLHVVEEQLHGFTHSEVGGYLLALWGLPYPIVEAVVHHHEPSRSTESRFGVVGAVHVADRLAHEWAVHHGLARKRDTPDGYDRGYLDRTGMHDQLQAWRTDVLLEPPFAAGG